MDRTTVLLVDDNPAMLAQIVQLLPPEFEVVDQLADGRDLVEVAANRQPDVIVLDITLPGASGFELAAQLTQAGCRARIVFLTVHNDPDYVRAAFDNGASAYVLKMRLALDVVPALRAVIEGGSFISPDCR